MDFQLDVMTCLNQAISTLKLMLYGFADGEKAAREIIIVIVMDLKRMTTKLASYGNVCEVNFEGFWFHFRKL